MLSETQFRQYITFTHQLSPAARDYLVATRTSEPSRMVGVHARSNICSWIISEKMQLTISTESHTAEAGFVLLCDYEEDILELWDQLPTVKITKVNRRGKRQVVDYTPDFLVLAKAGPAIVEVKTAAVLERLLLLEPDNWKKLESGEYQHLPSVEEFSARGLRHRIFVYSEDLRYLIANLDLMMRSRRVPQYGPEIPLLLAKAFEESFSWSLFDLRKRLSLDSYTPLIQMADSKKLFFDIRGEMLSEPMGCFVAPSTILVEESSRLRKQRKIFSDYSAESLSVALFPSQSYAEAALKKLEAIAYGTAPERSLRRWKEKISAGEKQGLSPLQSLISRRYLSGRSGPRINGPVSQFLQEYLLEKHASEQGLSVYRSYIKYVNLATDKHPFFSPVSRRTFTRWLRKIPDSIIAMKRQGRRGANAAADPTDPRQRALKAQLPWRKAAIDHYKADIYLIFYSDDGVVYAERPWVSAMIDLCTNRVLAFTLSFKSPSRHACAKVIRECVREHGMLPAEIMVDRGSDFKSVYFASLLSHYSLTLSLRAAAHSRYGGEIEALFGEFKKQWLSQRPGNLTDYKEARAVDGEKHPRKLAILKPHDLYRELKAFCAWRDAKPRGMHLESGAERFASGQEMYPFVGVPIQYDAEFILATAVESTEYTVDFQRGIHIDDLYYYSPAIAKIRGRKSRLEVRRDPENPHMIFARIGHQWEPCYSAHINSYSALDPVIQFERGLVAIEAANLRRKVRTEYDVELARIVREMDMIASTGQVPVASFESDVLTVDVVESPVVDLTSLRAVSVGEW